MKRAAAWRGVVIAGAILHVLGCNDAPVVGADRAVNACSPVDEPGASVTSEGLTPDGHYVVVVSRAGPMRVFYGVASHMVEGVITAVRQTCALEIDFDISGRSEVATFSPGPPGCAVPSTLKSGNAGDAIVQAPLTVLVPGATTSSSAFTFFCL